MSTYDIPNPSLDQRLGDWLPIGGLPAGQRWRVRNILCCEFGLDATWNDVIAWTNENYVFRQWWRQNMQPGTWRWQLAPLRDVRNFGSGALDQLVEVFERMDGKLTSYEVVIHTSKGYRFTINASGPASAEVIARRTYTDGDDGDEIVYEHVLDVEVKEVTNEHP